MRQSIFLTLINFQQAFEYINHNFLYYKLLKLDIAGNIHNIMKAWVNKIQIWYLG